MFKRMMTLVILVFALGLVPVLAQDKPADTQAKPAIVVHAFTVASGVKFPYDMNQLQSQAANELKNTDADQFDVVSDASQSQARVYTLDGEVLEWHKGNTAERMLIAAGTVGGRENAKIHFWLTDKDGKKVFETTDVIRQLWMRNGHEKSSGMLIRPFGDKIVERLKEAKLTPDAVAAK